MKYSDKRVDALDARAVQSGNKSWWTAHTMSYDWADKSALAPLTLPWFDDIDRRFLQAARLFSEAENPFEELMEVERLEGQTRAGDRLRHGISFGNAGAGRRQADIDRFVADLGEGDEDTVCS